MANVKITELGNYTDPQNADVIAIVDIASGVTKKIEAEVLVGAFLPRAMITPYAGSTAPSGWALCDGSAISRTTYAELFALVGTTYGSGDGSTTFNVPDLRGRAVVGLSTETEFNTLGKTGGAKTHALSASEMPAHSHTFSATTSAGGNHNHYVAYYGTSVSGYGLRDASNARSSGAGYTSTDGNHNHSVSGTTSTSGSGGSHNNLQPYGTLNYIIKV